MNYDHEVAITMPPSTIAIFLYYNKYKLKLGILSLFWPMPQDISGIQYEKMNYVTITNFDDPDMLVKLDFQSEVVSTKYGSHT